MTLSFLFEPDQGVVKPSNTRVQEQAGPCSLVILVFNILFTIISTADQIPTVRMMLPLIWEIIEPTGLLSLRDVHLHKITSFSDRLASSDDES